MTRAYIAKKLNLQNVYVRPPFLENKTSQLTHQEWDLYVMAVANACVKA